MSEFPHQCQDESRCSNESDSTPVRLYKCVHHCLKMLCIEHLREHDEYVAYVEHVKKRNQYQNELKHIWDDYIAIVDEDKILKEMMSLQTKLENHRKLRGDVDNLLSIDYLDDSRNIIGEIKTAIETVKEAMAQENRSKFIVYNTSQGNQNNDINTTTTESYVGAKGTNNNEGDAQLTLVENSTRKIPDLTRSRILDFLSDSNDEKDQTVSSEGHRTSDDEVDSTVSNEDKDKVLVNGPGPYHSWCEKNDASEPSPIMNITTATQYLPSHGPPKIEDIFVSNEEAFQNSKSIDSLGNVHHLQQPNPIDSDGQSSEASCY